MFNYLIDENLPSTLPFWEKIKFIHVSVLIGVNSDTDIWRYAFINELVIITKDADFYFRYLSSSFTPKVIWIRTGNLKKKNLNLFIENVWNEAEKMLLSSSFIIIDEHKIEGL